MKRFTNVSQYLLNINISYARGWEEALRRFDAFEDHQQKKRRNILRVA